MNVLAIPELKARVTLEPGHRLSDTEYLAFCEANPDLRVERTARGEIIIVPPAGGESDYRSIEAGGELRQWAKRNGRGRAFGSSVQFILPDGSALSPDSAWVSNERLAALSKKQRREFLRVVPEFVVEVMSPTDRLSDAQRKMATWIRNGVELGWLIHGDKRCVYVYRKNVELQRLSGIDRVSGEGPVEGFVLELASIWEGL